VPEYDRTLVRRAPLSLAERWGEIKLWAIFHQSDHAGPLSRLLDHCGG